MSEEDFSVIEEFADYFSLSLEKQFLVIYFEWDIAETVFDCFFPPDLVKEN